MGKIQTKAYGTWAADKPLEAMDIQRREPGKRDVDIAIQYCGICHSDLHTARNEWGGTKYPSVPGHEIVGRVHALGEGASKFKPGDLVAVGCMVDSCQSCASCKEGLEQFCESRPILTYNSPDRHSGDHTLGGYSQRIIVDERFVLSVPENLDPAATAPLLCAGITTWSPLKHWKVGPGTKVGVVGIGGLGHMGVKLAKALGAEVTVITTSPAKVPDAKRLGADQVVLSPDREAMRALRGTLDFILDCVSAQHDINAYLQLLKRDGNLVLVGLPENPLPLSVFSLVSGRKSLSGSSIGGIAETQEMLDFCGAHNIVSDIELIPIQGLNQAYERLLKGEVKYRFVIDMASLG